jgi:hypothetical protein
MDIDLPSDENESDDDSIFDGRIDLYEAYWLYVDGVRCVGPLLEQSAATKNDTERSPLARHYNHFYEKKQEHKRQCKSLPGNLPKYKRHFDEPRGNVQKVPRDNLDELGIAWDEGDDPIWLPPEYELPPVWEDDLEGMDKAELNNLVRSLRSENEKLREERDQLKQKLAKISESISNYLSLNEPNEPQQATSPQTCEKCGRTFDSKAAKHGHSSHCDGSVPTDNQNPPTKSEAKELAQLAEELPELSEEQSSEDYEHLSAEEELENLNHLLQGSL